MGYVMPKRSSWSEGPGIESTTLAPSKKSKHFTPHSLRRTKVWVVNQDCVLQSQNLTPCASQEMLTNMLEGTPVKNCNRKVCWSSPDISCKWSCRPWSPRSSPLSRWGWTGRCSCSPHHWISPVRWVSLTNRVGVKVLDYLLSIVPRPPVIIMKSLCNTSHLNHSEITDNIYHISSHHVIVINLVSRTF